MLGRHGAAEQIAAAADDEIAMAEKLEFFRRASHCFGRTALMLSGAGALGPFHVGVIKALVEEDLLPNVISGSSAGAPSGGKPVSPGRSPGTKPRETKSSRNR